MGIGFRASAAAAMTRSKGSAIAAVAAAAPARKFRRSIIMSPLSDANVARLRPIGQHARPHVQFGFHDGVKRPGAREMTAMLAGLMALNAFAIDAMVPALPDIGRSLHVAHENDRQLVVIAYFVGFAATQLLWGPLADRFGRKPIMAAGVGLYGIFALMCAFAPSFPVLIAVPRLDGRLGGGRHGCSSSPWSATCSRPRRWRGS